jgi:hypothetical protein
MDLGLKLNLHPGKCGAEGLIFGYFRRGQGDKPGRLVIVPVSYLLIRKKRGIYLSV